MGERFILPTAEEAFPLHSLYSPEGGESNPELAPVAEQVARIARRYAMLLERGDVAHERWFLEAQMQGVLTECMVRFKHRPIDVFDRVRSLALATLTKDKRPSQNLRTVLDTLFSKEVRTGVENAERYVRHRVHELDAICAQEQGVYKLRYAIFDNTTLDLRNKVDAVETLCRTTDTGNPIDMQVVTLVQVKSPGFMLDENGTMLPKDVLQAKFAEVHEAHPKLVSRVSPYPFEYLPPQERVQRNAEHAQRARADLRDICELVAAAESADEWVAMIQKDMRDVAPDALHMRYRFLAQQLMSVTERVREDGGDADICGKLECALVRVVAETAKYPAVPGEEDARVCMVPVRAIDSVVRVILGGDHKDFSHTQHILVPEEGVAPRAILAQHSG